jgi:hypothetical protein
MQGSRSPSTAFLSMLLSSAWRAGIGTCFLGMHVKGVRGIYVVQVWSGWVVVGHLGWGVYPPIVLVVDVLCLLSTIQSLQGLSTFAEWHIGAMDMHSLS